MYFKSQMNTKGGKMLRVQVTLDNAQVCSLLKQNEDQGKQKLRKRHEHELYFLQLYSNEK